MRQNKIPDEDLKAINASFKKDTGPVQTLGKNRDGVMITAKKKIVNDKTIIIQDFSGRVLSRQKAIFIPKKGLKVIGVKGQKYDDIALADRQLVVWGEDDFEPKNGG